MKYIAHGTPMPKERPRRGKQGLFYTPKTTRVYEDRIAWTLRQARCVSYAHPVWIRVEFHMPNEKRVDGDNLLKALFDGCTKGGLWKDDSLVMECSYSIFYCRDNPRTEWEVGLLTEFPTPIHCNGKLAAVELRGGDWVCTGCETVVSNWIVSPSFTS